MAGAGADHGRPSGAPPSSEGTKSVSGDCV